MQNNINLSYFAYGNIDFPCFKQSPKLDNPSSSVKSSASNLLQRNYLNFEPGTVKKLKNSFSQQNLSLDEQIFNRYHPEYKLYKNTNEQIIDLNNYLNPVKQFLYKDKDKTYRKENLYSLKKYYINNNSRYSTPLHSDNKDKIILKYPPNNNILIPNNYYLNNINSLPRINENNNSQIKTNQNVKLNSFIESKESPEYLRNYDKEALKNIDDYYIKNNENMHILSRFGNWITLRPGDKNRNHPLEKIKHGIYETSIMAPNWMDISSRRKKDNYKSYRKKFKVVLNKGSTRDNRKISFLFDSDQNNARPLFLRDSYEKNRLLFESNEKKL